VPKLPMCSRGVGAGVCLSRVAVVGGSLDNSMALDSTIFFPTIIGLLGTVDPILSYRATQNFY